MNNNNKNNNNNTLPVLIGFSVMILVFSYKVRLRFYFIHWLAHGLPAAPRVAFIVYGIQTFLLQ